MTRDEIKRMRGLMKLGEPMDMTIKADGSIEWKKGIGPRPGLNLSSHTIDDLLDAAEAIHDIAEAISRPHAAFNGNNPREIVSAVKGVLSNLHHESSDGGQG